MIDMMDKVCNKKIRLLREGCTCDAKVTRKYPLGSSRMKMVGVREGVVAQTKKVRARGGQRSACDKKNDPLMRQKMSACEAKAERMVRARSASDHNRSTRGHDE